MALDNLNIGKRDIPQKKRPGRPTEVNIFEPYVAELVGTSTADYVTFDGTADTKTNPDLRAAVNLLNKAGKTLGVTVKKTIEPTEDGTGVELTFWPVERRKTTPRKPKDGGTAEQVLDGSADDAAVESDAAEAEPATADATPSVYAGAYES